jgi:4-hydroxy-tetrahydrodipicolinate reductase
MAVRIAVSGAAGRMGRRLIALAGESREVELVQALEYAGHPLLGRPATELAPEAADEVTLESELGADAQVLIDFSLPKGTAARAAEAAERGIGLVIGTTGLDEAAAAAVEAAAERVPVLHAPNYSLGVNLLFRVAAEVARALGAGFDVEIVEAHHNRKADAPSGTALGLAERVCEALGRDPAADLVHGRGGPVGPRTEREIGMHALRLGSVVGEHTVHFGSDHERIELTHRAQSRDVFAAGALRAAAWIAGRAPGRYGMDDVLFADERP